VRTDSTETRREKAKARRRLEALTIILPDWLIEGMYAIDLQIWADDAEEASERFKGMSGSLCRDTRG
jgi:hypothetical protein